MLLERGNVTLHFPVCSEMNYNDYYAQQAGGALTYFVGARVQRWVGKRVWRSAL